MLLHGGFYVICAIFTIRAMERIEPQVVKTG